ncbi:MAG: hypothetical protein LBK95_18730 [Bifidobacteriaceae bacterium]|jgi:hypothetical protein|nr:hypothetical protein [Bifidobacteriaceae bacterium]
MSGVVQVWLKRVVCGVAVIAVTMVGAVIAHPVAAQASSAPVAVPETTVVRNLALTDAPTVIAADCEPGLEYSNGAKQRCMNGKEWVHWGTTRTPEAKFMSRGYNE